MSFEIDSSSPEITEAAARQMQALFSRASTDREFRQKLVSDPGAALAEFAGREVPGAANFRFIENEADVTVVLPDPVREGELSETELETVAGGTSPAIPILAAGIALGMAMHSLECENH